MASVILKQFVGAGHDREDHGNIQHNSYKNHFQFFPDSILFDQLGLEDGIKFSGQSLSKIGEITLAKDEDGRKTTLL